MKNLKFKIAAIIASSVLMTASAVVMAPAASAVTSNSGYTHTYCTRRHRGSFGYTNYQMTVYNPRRLCYNINYYENIHNIWIYTTDGTQLTRVGLFYQNSSNDYDQTYAVSWLSQGMLGSNYVYHDCYVNVNGTTGWSPTYIMHDTETPAVTNYKGQNMIAYLGTAYWG